MNRESGIRTGIVLVFLFAMCLYMRAGEPDAEKEKAETAAMEEETDSTETVQSLLYNNVIDLGDHMVAYRIMADAAGLDYGDRYIAIQDLDCGEILYLPDVYGEICQITVEKGSEIVIGYTNTENEKESVHIPIIFPSDAVENLCDGYRMKRKMLTETQGNMAENTVLFPRPVWKEVIDWEGKKYEVSFSRTSLAYERGIAEAEWICADYSLKVKDETGKILSEQTMLNYPIAYEEVYWMTDFSNDGFPDIIFCTEFDSMRMNYSSLYFMMWNTEAEAYESEPLPGQWSIAMWNTQKSAVICFVKNEQEQIISLDMFSFHGDEWELTGQLTSAENAVWNQEEGLWSRYDVQNIHLYPDDGWEREKVNVGEKTVRKYVRKAVTG